MNMKITGVQLRQELLLNEKVVSIGTAKTLTNSNAQA